MSRLTEVVIPHGTPGADERNAAGNGTRMSTNVYRVTVTISHKSNRLPCPTSMSDTVFVVASNVRDVVSLAERHFVAKTKKPLPFDEAATCTFEIGEIAMLHADVLIGTPT